MLALMLAFGETIGTILTIVSLLATAASLLSRKKVKLANLDDAVTTSATQGAYIPLIIGRARTGPVVLAVADWADVSDAPGGDLPGTAPTEGGKGFGSVPSPGSYREASLHGICVGPASELRAIYSNNELIWKGPITPESHPSGTLITVTEPSGAPSYFRVYWGLPDDPEIDLFAETHGVSTRFTHAFKILWEYKDLGTSRQWPRLEYEVVCPCYSRVGTTASEVPRYGDDLLPTWKSWNDTQADGGYLPPGVTPESAVTHGIWSFNRREREIVVLETRLLTATSVVDDDWLQIYPTGGVIKIRTNDNTLFQTLYPGFSAGLSASLSELGIGNAETKCFRIAATRIQQVHPSLNLGSWVSFAVYIKLGAEVPPEQIRNYAAAFNPTVTTTFLTSLIGGVQPVDVGRFDGVNPVHIIDQLLFARWPYGAGKDRSKFDIESINVAAELIEDEQIRGYCLIQDGEGLESVLAQYLQDLGLVIPFNPNTGKYTFRLVRYEASAPSIPETVMLDVPEIEVIHGDRPADVIAFTFLDRDRNYREVPVRVQDNGQIAENEVQRAEKVRIAITADRDSVSRIAPRRGQEALGSLATYQFRTNHATTLAITGARFRVPSLEGDAVQFIVTDVKRSLDSSVVEIGAVLDTYDPPESFSLGLDRLPEPPALPAIAPLDDFEAIEVPRALSEDRRQVEFLFAAARTSPRTRLGSLWLSRDGTTFSYQGTTSIVARGTLSGTLPADSPAYDTGTYLFDASTDVDMGALEDLTLDLAAWRAGRQVMLVGDEVIYLMDGYVTVPGSPAQGILAGLIRGRAGSRLQEHAAGTPFYVFLSHKVDRITSAFFVAGKPLHYKVAPVETGRVASIDTVAAKDLTVQGLAFTPNSPSAVRLAGFATSYAAGAGSIRLLWSYHSSQFPLTGLGTQPCGAATGISSPQGHFVVRIFDSGDVLVHETTTSDAFFDLSADLRASFSLDSGLDWTFQVYHVEGSFSSDPASLTLRSI